MGKYLDLLKKDIRIREGLNACINCGTCTAVCPAAEFYRYDPRQIIDTVQNGDDYEIEKLLKGDTIWYCGECMSCMPRCPRNNAVGLVIIALRSLSQDLGFFTESEKGRQQLALKRTIGQWTLNYGYCVYPRNVSYADHPESGPVWEWLQNNIEDVYQRLGANLDGKGTGALRKIPQESLDELSSIFDVTGATERFEKLEKFSAEKRDEMGLTDEQYSRMIYNDNNGSHTL